MEKPVLTWKLLEIMETEGIRPHQLYEEMGVNYRQITRMRKAKMPRMEQDKLEDLLLALNILKRPETPIITHADLFTFSLTIDELRQIDARKTIKGSIDGKAQNGA